MVPTPGHTGADVSVIVKGTAYGTVAITGKEILDFFVYHKSEEIGLVSFKFKFILCIWTRLVLSIKKIPKTFLFSSNLPDQFVIKTWILNIFFTPTIRDFSPPATPPLREE